MSWRDEPWGQSGRTSRDPDFLGGTYGSLRVGSWEPAFLRPPLHSSCLPPSGIVRPQASENRISLLELEVGYLTRTQGRPGRTRDGGVLKRGDAGVLIHTRLAGPGNPGSGRQARGDGGAAERQAPPRGPRAGPQTGGGAAGAGGRRAHCGPRASAAERATLRTHLPPRRAARSPAPRAPRPWEPPCRSIARGRRRSRRSRRAEARASHPGLPLRQPLRRRRRAARGRQAGAGELGRGGTAAGSRLAAPSHPGRGWALGAGAGSRVQRGLGSEVGRPVFCAR